MEMDYFDRRSHQIIVHFCKKIDRYRTILLAESMTVKSANVVELLILLSAGWFIFKA